MKIYSTGFLHKNYKSDIKKQTIGVDYGLDDFYSYPFLNHSNISFKSSFFNWDSIKKLFQTKKQKEKTVLDQNNFIDFNSAQKIFLEAIKKENSKCPNNITRKLFADAQNCTPNKAIVYAGLYNIFFKIRENGQLPSVSKIQKFADCFLTPEGKINIDAFYDFQEKAQENIASNSPEFLEKLFKFLFIAKDDNGLNKSVLNLYNYYFCDSLKKEDIQRNGKINLPLVYLIKSIPKTANYSINDVIKCAWCGDEPDIDAIDSISKNFKYIHTSFYKNLDVMGKSSSNSDSRVDTICQNILHFIDIAKNTNNGKYSNDYEEHLNRILTTWNSYWAKTLPFIKDQSFVRGPIDESGKIKFDISRLNRITSFIKTFHNLGCVGLKSQQEFIWFVANIWEFSEEELQDFLSILPVRIQESFEKLKKVLNSCCKNNKTFDKNLVNELSKLNYKKQNASAEDLCDYLSFIKTKNRINEKNKKLIKRTLVKTDFDLMTTMSLVKAYWVDSVCKNKNNKEFNKIIDLYLEAYNKHYEQYVKDQYSDSGNNYKHYLKSQTAFSEFVHLYTNILLLCLKQNGLNIELYNESDKLISLIGLRNAQDILIYSQGINTDQYNKFMDLLNLAKSNKQTLRDGFDDLSDNDINLSFTNSLKDIFYAQSLIDNDLLVQAFKLKIDNFLDFCVDVASLEDKWDKSIKPFIYPEKTEEYITAQENITTAKAKIAKIKSFEQKKLEAQNKERIKVLEEEITSLKQKLKDNISSAEVKFQISEKQKEIKKLNSEIQSYYQSDVFKNLILDINKNQRIISSMLSKKLTDNEEIIKHLKTLAIIIECFDDDTLKKYLDLMTDKTEAGKKNLSNFLNEKFFNRLDLTFSDDVLKYLNFAESKYIGDLLQEKDEDAIEYIKEICELIIKNPQKTPKEIFDNLGQNIETRKIFEELGIDYEKYTTVDKNSYVKVDVKIDAEKSKQGAILNLEEDLNSNLWSQIPELEREKIFSAITNAGFELKTKKEVVYDEVGYNAGTKIVKRLYKNGKPIQFFDILTILNAIKDVMNKEDYWNNANELSDDKRIARDTLINHLLKIREKEYQNAINIKNSEVKHLEVHKTDMNDIVHSLFLGNHACCCTSIGDGCNSWSAPLYVKNKCISSIEVMDGKDFVGNTMCFLAKVDGKLSLILDNIELKPKYQFNDKIRDAILEYAKKMCKEIGLSPISIYAGTNFHKVDLKEFTSKKYSVDLVGSTQGEDVYVDFSHGNNGFGYSKNKKTVSLYKII